MRLRKKSCIVLLSSKCDPSPSTPSSSLRSFPVFFFRSSSSFVFLQIPNSPLTETLFVPAGTLTLTIFISPRNPPKTTRVYFFFQFFPFLFFFFQFINLMFYTLISYTFKSTSLLRRAMTHASFSEENNKAFSIFGATIIETSVSFNLLSKDVDVSAKELNRRISLISNVDSSCAVDAMRLSLHKVVRVSPKTNSSSPSVLCGAFRSIFGAIALDAENSDDAGKVFLTVHGRDFGVSMAM